MTDIASEWAARAQQLNASNTTNAKAIFDALQAIGVTMITATFDGCGDSGQIESFEIEGADALEGDVPFIHVGWTKAQGLTVSPLRDAVEDLCYALLEQSHNGWEINEGAFGTFTFIVPDRTVALEFNERYVEYNTTEHIFEEA